MQNIITHLKTIVGSKDTKSRPALQYVHVTPDYMYATDSHRAIKVAHRLPISEPALLDLDTLATNSAEIVENIQYPEIDRLFKTLTDDNSVQLEFKVTKLQLKLLTAMKQEEQIVLVPEGEKLTVTGIDNDVTIMSFQLNKPLDVTDNIYVSTAYFIDAIKALSDVGAETFKLSNINDTLLPLQFGSNGFDYIVAPRRKQ